MAVAVHQQLAVEIMGRPPAAIGEKLREMKALLFQAARLLIARQQITQLVAKHRDAARLQAHDRRPGVDLFAQLAKDSREQPSRAPEKSIVVERPSAAERLARNQH